MGLICLIDDIWFLTLDCYFDGIHILMQDHEHFCLLDVDVGICCHCAFLANLVQAISYKLCSPFSCNGPVDI